MPEATEHEQRMERRQNFIEQCECIVREKGTETDTVVVLPPSTLAITYTDSVVEITLGENGNLEIVKLENWNPVVYRHGDEVIRHHGEYTDIESHVNELVQNL